jgi:hypothetical protein
MPGSIDIATPKRGKFDCFDTIKAFARDTSNYITVGRLPLILELRGKIVQIHSSANPYGIVSIIISFIQRGRTRLTHLGSTSTNSGTLPSI